MPNSLSQRRLTPELLDHLPQNDPGAISSRKDLHRINLFMGNEAWIRRNIPTSTQHICEIGAGDGNLLSTLTHQFPTAKIKAYDLAPRPTNLPQSIQWISGDIFTVAPETNGGVLIANLFLHHFTDSQLATLSPWLQTFDTLIINEPLRAPLPLILGKLAYPFIHPITRHDMRVSIEAGFQPGELPKTLQLDPETFTHSETKTHRGSLRLICKKQTLA